MAIAIDATYSIGPNLTGVGIYSRELIADLAAAHSNQQFRLCYRPHRFRQALREPVPANCRRRLLLDFLPAPGVLFHGLNQRLPHGRLRRSVCTFHDLFVLTGEYSTPEFRARFAAQARDAADRADRIICVSAFTAGQVRELLGVEPERIRVVHHGIRPLPRREVPREQIVLHVGAIQARKNVARLVAAFETLRPTWRLVLAGSWGYGAESIVERIERSPARERIHVTGYVDDRQLADLYGRASVFAFPSLDEGFGMPVLEAMAQGVPVIASKASALPEVCGDAAVLVDPLDTEQLAHQLTALTENESLRESLAGMGAPRASQFTWRRAADQTWAVYAELL